MASTDLVDLDSELKPFLAITGSGEDLRLSTLNDIARSLIEDYLDRFLVSRGTITEFHSPDGSNTIWLSQWPVISVSSVHEDTAREYGASTLLTADVDYIVSAPRGKLLRIASSQPSVWACGWRTVRVIYSGGYQSTALVPAEFKHAALRTVALLWNEVRREEIGYSSISDAQGNIQRLVPGGLTSNVKAALYCHRRIEQRPSAEVDL
jgi:hypothetical protein